MAVDKLRGVGMHWPKTLLKNFISFYPGLVFLSPIYGNAQTFESLASEEREPRASLSLVEINPADLIWGRYRIAHESLIFESVSVGWVGEVQNSVKQGSFEEKNIAAGVSLQYYPQSVTLNGLFVRGECDIALASVTDAVTAKGQMISGKSAFVQVAGDVGWRVRLSQRLTGSAAYGLRSTLSQDLWNDRGQMISRWLRQKNGTPDVRVQINLGVLL